MFEHTSFPESFGPNLLYAIATNFEYFPFFSEPEFKLSLIVEFRKAGMAAEFRDALLAVGRELGSAEFGVDIGPSDPAITIATVRMGTAPVRAPQAFGVWDEFLLGAELSFPVIPVDKQSLLRSFVQRPRSTEPVLLGLIDDGCPFAREQFRSAAPGSRVFALWDQNSRSLVNVVDANGNACTFGRPVMDFNYGLEFWRDTTVVGLSETMGLDEWIGLYRSASGSIDEDTCYAYAGFTSLRGRVAHGAHVMDVLAGDVPTSSRLSLDRVTPPSWRKGTDAASQTDIVFVQIPQVGVDDATGGWLTTYVRDGVEYILSCAKPGSRVVINISYGPTTRAHDGTDILEKYLNALLTLNDGNNGRPRLEIVLAAGNSYQAEGHVQRRLPRRRSAAWTWRLLPDNNVPCLAQIWMDKTSTVSATVSLTPPAGAAAGAPATIVSGVSGNNRFWSLSVPRTIAAPSSSPAACGDWTITVKAGGSGVLFHAYVGRTDPNMGARTGARRSYFVDPSWEKTQSAAASHTLRNGEFDKTGSLISRLGTLSGIATDFEPAIRVAGGFVVANGRKSRYASAGPARGGPRLGPDFALPCDESYGLTGIRAGATRSGSAFRMLGTSVAAPQLARHVARNLIPQAVNPDGQEEVNQRGAGNLEPP